ncbi:nucleoside phosphorylase domain-containing protein [Aspergillus taichungensis]|uniref:Nucleoside phosphorylase domain-containing protein n=1 Tax=Aspergillus taichungensis TaxID=482145 RepID=A0A2J5I399_9EURO|nr:nucleoside phosphorylase domain-containing protein [Aspergillus taichungensis]
MGSSKKRLGKRKRTRQMGTDEKSLVGLGRTRKERFEQEKKKKLNPDEYTVGWICALSDEVVPAFLLLDEEHERLPGRVNDGNSYYFGRMGEHNVIIATLPMGSYGVTSAATVVSHLVTSFSSIRFCLMVGIGAGIPTLAPDMRLGDVVVSIPNNQLPGVVEFDMGTELHDSSFTRKGSLNRPPVFLLTAAATLRTEISLARSRIPARIAHVQQRHTATRGRFSHPGKDKDRLFPGDYPCESDDRACGTCDMSRLVTRPCNRPTDPIVYFGTIASGSKLVRNPRLRDQIGKSYNALCIEMEAAGIMNNLPCLVIRGISDYADSHKNDIWHHYAAMTASACARELLGYVTATVVRAERKVHLRLEKTLEKGGYAGNTSRLGRIC